MKSLQSRFLLLVLIAILLPVSVAGAVALKVTREKSDRDSVSIMNLTCQEEADRINLVLRSIENSVGLEASHAVRHLDNIDRFFDDEDYRKDYTDEAERLFLDIAEGTDGAVSFYFRYNAEEIASTQGFLYSRDNVDAPFSKIPLTDISIYDPDDTEHVGWYYIPVRNGIPTWMAPYQNRNLGIYMISYVIPLFQDGRLLGIIGMDVNFQVIINELEQIHPYETGYAFLTGADGTVLYHPSPEIEYGTLLDGSVKELPVLAEALTSSAASSKGTLLTYRYENVEKKLAYTTLANGSVLSLVADTRDIDSDRNALLQHIAIAALASAGIFLLAAFYFTWKALEPLRELADTADQVATGNLDVEIPQARTTEIERLIDAYKKTVDRMREQLRLVDSLAHHDALTGLYNRSSFREKELALDAALPSGKTVFAIMMIDVNELKTVNDTYGHEAGDAYLMQATSVITEIFGEEVYRIGGDEFATFLVAETEDPDAARTELAGLLAEKTALLDRAMEQNADGEPWERFSAAYGAAISTPEDRSSADVLERADAAMYEKKSSMKLGRT